MGINYKGSQGQTERAVVLQEEVNDGILGSGELSERCVFCSDEYSKCILMAVIPKQRIVPCPLMRGAGNVM
jgi:hypothetical protein